MALSYSDNTNLAYDLSLFDNTEREQRERERAENEKARQIRMSARSVSRSGSRFLIVVACGLLFAGLFAVNFFNTRKVDMARKVAEQQTLLANAQDDNALLQSKLDSKVNINYIEEYATNVLGMEKVTASQKQYISVNTEDLIETAEEESGGLIGGIKKWFGEIAEYIGI